MSAPPVLMSVFTLALLLPVMYGRYRRHRGAPAAGFATRRGRLLVMGMAEGFTGYLLPWDQTAYWASVVGINLNGTAPFLGPWLAQFLRSGQDIGAETLTRFYSLHMLVIPGAIFALIGLHLYLVIRLGVTSPPWSKEAAGVATADEPTDLRTGLTRPAARGAGGSE